MNRCNWRIIYKIKILILSKLVEATFNVEQIKQTFINKKLHVNTCTIYGLFFSEAVASCDTFQLVGSFEDTTGDSSKLNGKSDEQCQYQCLMKSEVKYIQLNIFTVGNLFYRMVKTPSIAHLTLKIPDN